MSKVKKNLWISSISKTHNCEDCFQFKGKFITGARKRFRRPTTQATLSSDQEVSASVNRFKVTRNRVSTKNNKNELQSGKTTDYKVPTSDAIIKKRKKYSNIYNKHVKLQQNAKNDPETYEGKWIQSENVDTRKRTMLKIDYEKNRDSPLIRVDRETCSLASNDRKYLREKRKLFVTWGWL